MRVFYKLLSWWFFLADRLNTQLTDCLLMLHAVNSRMNLVVFMWMNLLCQLSVVTSVQVIKIAFDEESTKQSKTKGLLSKAKFQQASWASANGSNGEDISVLMCGEQGERVFTQLLID